MLRQSVAGAVAALADQGVLGPEQVLKWRDALLAMLCNPNASNALKNSCSSALAGRRAYQHTSC